MLKPILIGSAACAGTSADSSANAPAAAAARSERTRNARNINVLPVLLSLSAPIVARIDPIMGLSVARMERSGMRERSIHDCWQRRSRISLRLIRATGLDPAIHRIESITFLMGARVRPAHDESVARTARLLRGRRLLRDLGVHREQLHH